MHETVFTKHFSDLGFKHGALMKNEDSAMYIHPLEMLKEGISNILHYQTIQMRNLFGKA